MDLSAAEKLAHQLFQEHLPGWKVLFTFDDSRAALGACLAGVRANEAEIVLSKYLTVLTDEACVRNAILHEIAHALAGRDDTGHGDVWKIEAQRIGVEPAAFCLTSAAIDDRNLTKRERGKRLTALKRFILAEQTRKV